MVGYTSDKDLSAISIMEPSCGEGEFLVEIVKRLYKSSLLFGFDANAAYQKNVYAVEIDDNKVAVCVKRIKEACPLILNPQEKIVVEDFLMTNSFGVDIIVGNPPYIRYEQIPKDKIKLYKSVFTTFFYRPDMYVLFFEKTLGMLRSGGKHCFICSNRWMRNTYGKLLRCMVASQYHLEKIINMEHSSAFFENVLAYPAITLISKTPKSSVVEIAEFSDIKEMEALSFHEVQHPTDGNWEVGCSPDEDYSMLSLIEEQGFRIGIGVATGADSIFVSAEFKGVIEEELLIPAINARNLKGNEMKWDGRFLINPYTASGKLIDLNDFPKAKKFLEFYRERLSARHKAKKNPGRWYATLDPISQTLQRQAKILLPDMSGNTFIFVDEGKYYPQHNLYYITGGTLQELQLIAAMLMSDYVRKQLASISNHMNGGYVRWQSQYLRLLRIPNIKDIPNELKEAVLRSYQTNDIIAINNYMNQIVDLIKGNLMTHENTTSKQRQLSFDSF